MVHALRVFTGFLVLSSLLVTTYTPAGAYGVSITANTNAQMGISTDPRGVNTARLDTVSAGISSSRVCPQGNCPPGNTGTAQASFSGTASLGTLSAVANGSTSQSGIPFGESAYSSTGTLRWEDTVTITQEGDFIVTLRLDVSIMAAGSGLPGLPVCTVPGPIPAGGGARLSLIGPVPIVITDSVCAHPNDYTVTRTFHGVPGQSITFQSELFVDAGGRGALASGITSFSLSSTVDAAHTGTFKLDPATPGAAYTTQSGVSYASVIPNQLPVANAGTDQTVHVGSTVTLDGTGSADPDGNTPLTFAWGIVSKPAGSNATLSDPSVSMPSVTVDKLGDYIFALTVTDSLGASSLSAQVKVSTSNSSPIADAGPDQAVIALGSTIHLNGTQSYDPDGDPITYAWSLGQVPTGSAATLSNASAASPSFTADVQGNYVATIVVQDSHGAFSAFDSVTVSFTNVKPVANAGGNKAGSVGQTIQLNGSGSDANGDPLSYSWVFVSKPSSSVAALSNPSGAVTQFTADLAGTYIVSLVVNDGYIDSDPDTVTVTITSRQDQVIQSLRQAINVTNGLSVGVFKNHNMPNALTNKINAVLQDIDQGLYQQALDKLKNDVHAKTDGCASITGVPDKNDWITDCGAQGQIAAPINQAITILQGM